jgi:Ca2+-binding RTX toxin-like protein
MKTRHPNKQSLPVDEIRVDRTSRPSRSFVPRIFLPLVAVIFLVASGGSDAMAASNAAQLYAGINGIYYNGASDMPNNVTVSAHTASLASGPYYVDITGPSLVDASHGCERLTTSRFECFAEPPVHFNVRLGERDDRITNLTSLVLGVWGLAGNDVLVGGAGTDYLRGGAGNDQLRGGGGCDGLQGNDGNDVLDGEAGFDQLEGNEGNDTADYGSRTAPLAVSIDSSAAAVASACVLRGNDGEAGEGDVVYDDVENIRGGTGNDILIGSAAANVLDGGAGHDRLDGGLGPDSLVGGDGEDNAEYMTRPYQAFSPGGVTVNLDGVANDGAPNEGDNVFADIENVWGTSMNDTLIGAQSVPNMLQGMGGNDTLSGGEPPCGQLCLIGRSDRLDGGPGYDTIDYRGRGSVTASNDGLPNDGVAGEMDNDVAFEYVIRDFIRIR